MREGDNKASQEKYAMLPRKARSYDIQMNEYLRSLAHPAKYTALIPDPTTFPRGLAQIRSVITASTWRTNTTPGGDDEIFLVMFPNLNNAFDGYHGRFELDGTTYTDSAFDVHEYTNWSTTLQAFRPVSMCCDVTYIGPALDNQGQVAIACFPPHITAPTRTKVKRGDLEKQLSSLEDDYNNMKLSKVDFHSKALKLKEKMSSLSRDPRGVGDDPDLDFETVSEYNYSYTGAARAGAYQIWMPDSSRAFNSAAPTSVQSYLPYLVFAAKGLPLPEAGSGETWDVEKPIFRIEVTLNIETYSVSQMLTANQQAGKPDALKMNHALATLSKAHVNGNTSARGGSGDSVYSQISNIAKSAAGFIWDNRALIPPLIEGAATLFA